MQEGGISYAVGRAGSKLNKSVLSGKRRADPQLIVSNCIFLTPNDTSCHRSLGEYILEYRRDLLTAS